MIVYHSISYDKIHFLDMFRTCSKKVSRVKHELFPKSVGDLWAMFWHHPWCLWAGLKIKKRWPKIKKMKCFSEAPESYLKSFRPRIKFKALFSHRFMHFFIFHIFTIFPDMAVSILFVGWTDNRINFWNLDDLFETYGKRI